MFLLAQLSSTNIKGDFANQNLNGTTIFGWSSETPEVTMSDELKNSLKTALGIFEVVVSSTKPSGTNILW